MLTQRFWAPLTSESKPESTPESPGAATERRTLHREPADFYGVEVVAGSRYLRRITNVSPDGLLLVNPLGDECPGQIIDLELPHREATQPVTRLQFGVVYVAGGKVGVRRLDSAAPLAVDELGGPIAL